MRRLYFLLAACMVLGRSAVAGGPDSTPRNIDVGDAPQISQPPTPRGGDTQSEHKPATAEEHQNGQDAERGTQERPLFIIQLDNPQDHHAITPKAESQGDWYANPDWWVAGFTGALFVVTAGLWFYTAQLWRTTRRAVKDGERAIRAAEQSAIVASTAQGAIITLWNRVDFFRNNVALNIEKAREPALNLIQPARAPDNRIIVYTFQNYGKSPAIIRSYDAIARVRENAPTRADVDAIPERPIAGTIMIRENMRTTPLVHHFFLSDSELSEVDAGRKKLFFYGYMKCSDIIGNDYIATFALQYVAIAIDGMPTTRGGFAVVGDPKRLNNPELVRKG